MKNLLLLFTLLFANKIFAQCPVGQVEITVGIQTDDYGSEGYWELLPDGNNCSDGTLLSGGNPDVGCTGAGDQSGPNSGGYGNNGTFLSNPICVDSGATFSLFFADDWGDGGTNYTVYINGFPLYEFTGSGSPAEIYSFVANGPLLYNMELRSISTTAYNQISSIAIKGNLFNESSSIINSFDLSYSIDGGSIITSNISGLDFSPFTGYDFIHPLDWTPLSTGTFSLKVWASNLNGNSDLDNSNDTLIKQIIIGDPIPFIIDYYVTTSYSKTIINQSNSGVSVPRDLDFHPILNRYELWVINKSTESSGGKTVKFSHAGFEDQTALLQQDGNAYHFMSLPTGIAFSDNENFATSTGVYDANHDGGEPFTGPALWSSDPTIYAQESGGNGSHLDMLHESPYCMGICHEKDNVFWVTDGNSNNIVRYDFQNDHGPGNADHADGIIRRYTDATVEEDPTHNIPSHLVLDKSSNWLYYVSTADAKVKRLDITSGSFSNNLTPHEGTEEYSKYSGAIVEDYITTGLLKPSGIELFNDRLLVSDYDAGNILIYDITNSTPLLLSTLYLNEVGIMGIKVGPDGKIWYVNSLTNNVIRLDTTDIAISISENYINEKLVQVYPNPANSYFDINIQIEKVEIVKLKMLDVLGRILIDMNLTSKERIAKVDISQFPNGQYFLEFTIDGSIIHKKLIKE